MRRCGAAAVHSTSGGRSGCGCGYGWGERTLSRAGSACPVLASTVEMRSLTGAHTPRSLGLISIRCTAAVVTRAGPVRDAGVSVQAPRVVDARVPARAEHGWCAVPARANTGVRAPARARRRRTVRRVGRRHRHVLQTNTSLRRGTRVLGGARVGRPARVRARVLFRVRHREVGAPRDGWRRGGQRGRHNNYTNRMGRVVHSNATVWSDQQLTACILWFRPGVKPVHPPSTACPAGQQTRHGRTGAR